MDSIEELPKRIIKFRCWDGVHMYLSPFEIQHLGMWFDAHWPGSLTMNPPVLMQFTGMEDRNKVEIYEHDRVRVLYTDWPSKDSNDPRSLEQYLIDISRIGVVVFHGLGWCVKFDGDRYDTLIVGTHGRIEVIGTIYQS